MMIGSGGALSLLVLLFVALLPEACLGVRLQARRAREARALDPAADYAKDVEEGEKLKMDIAGLQNVTASLNLQAEEIQQQMRDSMKQRSLAVTDFMNTTQPKLAEELSGLRAKYEKLHGECNEQYKAETAKFRAQITNALTNFHAQKALLAHTITRGGKKTVQDPTPTAEPRPRYEVLEENAKLRKEKKVMQTNAQGAQNRVNVLKADLAKSVQGGAAMNKQLMASSGTYEATKKVYEEGIAGMENKCATKDAFGMDGFAAKVQKVLDSANTAMHEKKMAEQRRIEAAMRKAWWGSSSFREAHGGDWTEVSCGPGQVVLSGGCEATDGGYIFQYNGPAGRNGWKCGGHGGSRKVPDGFLRTRTEVYGHKRVFAVCAPDNGPVQVTIKKQNGGDWTTASCDAGQVVVGGGCNAHGGPHMMQYSAPEGNNAWKCGGHGGPKEVWAICVQDPDTFITIKAQRGGDWTNIWCDPGQRVTGGGCNADGGKHVMQYNGPESHMQAWKCGGHGGHNKVWRPRGWDLFNHDYEEYGHKIVYAICTKNL